MTQQKKIDYVKLFSIVTNNKSLMTVIIAISGVVYANAETLIKNAVKPLIEERVADVHKQIRRDIARSFARIEIALRKDGINQALKSDRENRKQEQDIENEYLNLMEKEDERYGK